MQWELSPQSLPRMVAIAEALAGVKRLMLATDPDREGEAISWHLSQELQVRGLAASELLHTSSWTPMFENSSGHAAVQAEALSAGLVIVACCSNCAARWQNRTQRLFGTPQGVVVTIFHSATRIFKA